MNPYVFRINEALSKIKKCEEKIIELEKIKENAINKLSSLHKQADENPEVFYCNEDKIDMAGHCYYLISESNRKIKEYNKQINTYKEKINKITQRK